ncbi:MAG: sigma-70 family RNA polymerase sigma factor [Deltaproteobacteria bacterium]|nr:sigma-70 family RNA polymerase sigma factor [Deltaproteobacteria bacterium]
MAPKTAAKTAAALKREPAFSSGMRLRRASDDRDEPRGTSMRDSVDRYLDDLGQTTRITPGEEIAYAERFFNAASECLAIARAVGLRLEPDGDPDERDVAVKCAIRLWRLLDEHEDASQDMRRTGMVRMVEEELGHNGMALRHARQQMAAARGRARDASEMMTQGNLALVVYVAKSYRGRGVPMADLIQEGNITLMRAVERFDPDRGARLGTYATAWLHRSMQRAVRSLSRTVRLAESAKNARSCSVPIDEPLGEDRLSLTDVLYADDAVAPDDLAAREQLRGRARRHIDRLPPQEALVVRRYFGVGQSDTESLRAIGDDLGVSRERVRQIKEAALGKLKRRMRRLASD